MDTSSLPEVTVCRAPQLAAVPAVSVVIPAYNRSGSILTSVRSVLAQSWQDFELLVVDDGSSDDTVETVLTLEDPRIGVLKQPNQGPSGARNTGALASSAAIVAFQDSDDIWLPDKLERQMQVMADDAVVASYCGMIVTGATADDGTPVLRLAPRFGYASGDITKALLQSSMISTQTLIARRQALLDVDLFDTAFRALEDWDLVLRLAQLGPIVPVEDALVVQRFSDNSLTHLSENWAHAHKGILEKHAALLGDHPQAAARQWSIVAGRFRHIGAPAASRAAARQALRFGGVRPKPLLQYLRTFLSFQSGA